MKRSRCRNLEAGTGTETTEECCLLARSLWLVQPAFLNNPEMHTHHRLGHPTSITHQGKAPPTCLQANLRDAFSQPRFLFPDDSSVSGWQTNKQDKNKNETLTIASAQKCLLLPWVTVGRRETRRIGVLRMSCVYLVKGHISTEHVYRVAGLSQLRSQEQSGGLQRHQREQPVLRFRSCLCTGLSLPLGLVFPPFLNVASFPGFAPILTIKKCISTG